VKVQIIPSAGVEEMDKANHGESLTSDFKLNSLLPHLQGGQKQGDGNSLYPRKINPPQIIYILPPFTKLTHCLHVMTELHPVITCVCELSEKRQSTKQSRKAENTWIATRTKVLSQ